MKQPKRPTRAQKEAIAAAMLNPDRWSVIGETEFYIKIINKYTRTIRRVDRYGKVVKER